MSFETDAELYEIARDKAAEHFARTHPAAYGKMCHGVMLDYSGHGYIARQRHLDRQAAIADGFPSFARWLSTRTPAQEAAAA